MKITMELTDKSIGDALKAVKRYQKDIERKQKMLLERLAMIGVQEASVRFASAMYDGVNDVRVNLRRIENGWAITAKGQAVCFIEFGSGVYHNPSEPYPNPRPPGVVGIGEYGQGKGKRQFWYFNNKKAGAKGVFTRGNPASLSMWYATEEMRRSLLDIAREVFRA